MPFIITVLVEDDQAARALVEAMPAASVHATCHLEPHDIPPTLTSADAAYRFGLPAFAAVLDAWRAMQGAGDGLG